MAPVIQMRKTITGGPPHITDQWAIDKSHIYNPTLAAIFTRSIYLWKPEVEFKFLKWIHLQNESAYYRPTQLLSGFFFSSIDAVICIMVLTNGLMYVMLNVYVRFQPWNKICPIVCTQKKLYLLYFYITIKKKNMRFELKLYPHYAVVFYSDKHCSGSGLKQNCRW